MSGEALEISSPETFLDLTGSLAQISADKIKNAKKKSVKRELKKKAQAIGKKIGDHLIEHGFVVCDNFIPLDLVRRVRIESGLFKEHFEQSEIWVGKEADVGAHLSVPSVRGDKVLWMCGSHNTGVTPEGVTRLVKTIGDIEPCELKIKAAAPIRKFNALKELITSCDTIIEQLKDHVDNVKGIYERSDAMLAIYPGGGSRFAKHIDNTTHDGRRLTVLVYLNPNWTRDLGGALRLTPVSNPDPNIPPTQDYSNKRIDVFPEAGRLLIFYSSIIHHEVLPTYGDRLALTVWYYDETERKEAVLQAKEAGRGESVAKATVEQQKEAKSFIGELMGGDTIGDDGGDPTQGELDILANRVKNLTPEALSIVSSITGAPSMESFKQGFELLSPDDLKSMRSLFRRMGLNN